MKILHVLGVEHRHSGEVQCIVYNSLNPVLTQRSYCTYLAVLPRPPQLLNVNADPDADASGGYFFVNSTPIHYSDLHRTTSITQQAFKPIADVPAYLIRGPSDCTALIGGTVCLTVTYGGFPKATVKWYHGAVSSSPILLLFTAFFCFTTRYRTIFNFKYQFLDDLMNDSLEIK